MELETRSKLTKRLFMLTFQLDYIFIQTLLYLLSFLSIFLSRSSFLGLLGGANLAGLMSNPAFMNMVCVREPC